jgi:hypothetical protein
VPRARRTHNGGSRYADERFHLRLARGDLDNVWLGVVHSIEGMFVRLDSGRLLQMEALSTDAKATAARMLLAEWVKRAVP